MGNKAKILLSLGIVVTIVTGAPAGLQSFDSLGSFAASTGSPLQHVDFNGVLTPSQTFQQFFPPAGITRFPAGDPGAGVRFSINQTGDDGQLFIVKPTLYSASLPANSLIISSELNTLANNNLTINLSSPAHAAGLTLSSFDGSDFQITLSNGETVSTATKTVDQGFGFEGVVSDVPFTSLRVDILGSSDDAQGDVINSTDFYFGDTLRPTPLPPTMAIFAAGSCALGAFGWVTKWRTKCRLCR